MRKPIVMALVLGLLLGALISPAEAGKKKKKKKEARVERVVEAPYQCPCGTSPGLGWIIGDFGGAIIPTGADDLFVKVDLKDQVGPTVHFSLSQGDVDGDGLSDSIGVFCGSTGEEPLSIKPGLELQVFIRSGVCPTPTDGVAVATGGTITATFSNLP